MKIDEAKFATLSESEKELVLKSLEELAKQREENPLWFYNHPTLSVKPPHEKQLAFHSLWTQTKAFFGGNQSGKTTAGIADDLIQALPREDLPEHLRRYKRWEPPFHARLFAPSVMLLETVLQSKLKEMVPFHTLVGGTWESAYSKEFRMLKFKCGSTFQFMTYEQELSKMGGATLHRIHYDEEPPHRIRYENRFRLAKYRGDEILTQTPLEGLSWTYHDIWKKRGEEQESNVFLNDDLSIGVVVVDLDENPHLSTAGKAQALEGMPEVEREARKSGKFVHFAGLIYADFDTNKHVIPDQELPDNKYVIVGIDPGIRNKCAVVYTYIDVHDRMYVFDEIYEEGKTIGDICDRIHHYNTHYQISPRYYVIDPASRNRNNQTGRSDAMEFQDHGIPTIPGQHDVEPGISRVRERLGAKKLYVFESCKNLINEFEYYRWRDPPNTGEDGKARPIKTQDHLLDALRYVIMSRPYAPHHVVRRNETPLQRAMREDQERAARGPQRTSEFGGLYY